VSLSPGKLRTYRARLNKGHAMPLSDDQLRAIGRTTVSFGQLEHWTFLLLQVFINPKDQNIGRVAFEGAQFTRMLETINKLCPFVLGSNPELMGRVKKFTGRASGLAKRRNRVLHALWVDNRSEHPLEDRPGEMVGLHDVWTGERKTPTRAAELDQLSIDVALAVREVELILAELLHRAN
jgi:hypothetical protein